MNIYEINEKTTLDNALAVWGISPTHSIATTLRIRRNTIGNMRIDAHIIRNQIKAIIIENEIKAISNHANSCIYRNKQAFDTAITKIKTTEFSGKMIYLSTLKMQCLSSSQIKRTIQAFRSEQLMPQIAEGERMPMRIETTRTWLDMLIQLARDNPTTFNNDWGNTTVKNLKLIRNALAD